MNKDEILAKSRKENKGADLAEMDERRKGWQASFFAGLAVMMIMITLQYVTNHEKEAGALITVLMAMDFGMFLRGAIKKRGIGDFALAGIFLAITILSGIHYVKYLIG